MSDSYVNIVTRNWQALITSYPQFYLMFDGRGDYEFKEIDSETEVFGS